MKEEANGRYVDISIQRRCPVCDDAPLILRLCEDGASFYFCPICLRHSSAMYS